jgi:4-hydroxy-2-oxoheptanedioate aldolase
MRPNTVKQLWREGKPAIGAFLAIPSSFSAEIMAHAGFDWLCIDTQHGAIDFNAALPMLQAISTTETAPFVRVGWNEPSVIMKYLDAGAIGIIVPMIETRADAEAAVKACRFPPVGQRSAGPYRAALWAGSDYVQQSNEEVALVVMIETPQALKNLDEIAAVPGVDALYIGPSDLSQALGLGLPYNIDNAPHVEAVKNIREAAVRHGKVPGVHTAGAAPTNRYIGEGFKFIHVLSDTQGLGEGIRAQVSAVNRG